MNMTPRCGACITRLDTRGSKLVRTRVGTRETIQQYLIMFGQVLVRNWDESANALCWVCAHAGKT